MNRSRRRSYSSSDDEEDSRRYKRSRQKSPARNIQYKLHSLIRKVGEKSSASVESNIDGLARVLDSDMPNAKSTILDILYECVLEMPSKLTVYSTLIGLLNLHHYNTGGEFVEILVRGMKDEIRASNFSSARLIVRFLADLVNCHVVFASSLLSMFENFMEVTREEPASQTRNDWYVFTILSSLPWVGAELFEKKEVEFTHLLGNIDSYIRSRQKIHVPALRVWSIDDPNPQEEYLDCMWSQICTLRSNGWQEHHITRPYRAFAGSLCDAMQHDLPMFVPPSDHINYPLPCVVFRLFDYTDVPEDGPVLPGLHAIERFLIEEHLHLIVNTHFLDKKDCAANLLDVSFSNKIPLNYMILEVLFSQLFNMPRPVHLELFYGSVMIELCKLQPSTMPQVLAQTTEMIYERLDTMNTSCIERLTNWFSYHLSNFMFRWDWSDWAPDVSANIELPKPKFIKEVLQKCIRLSYYDRISSDVPAEFAPIMPARPRAMFKYEQQGVGNDPGTLVAHKLIQAIKAKCDNEDILEILQDLPNPLKDHDTDDPNFNPLKVEVFTQTLLFLGAKSFSHSFAAIAKFYDVFKILAKSEEGQLGLLRAMKSLWRYHQQIMCVLVDKLLKTEIVTCSAVANWVFSPEMSADLTSFYIWEIMHSTINKMNSQVNMLQKELDYAKYMLEQAERRGDDPMHLRDIPTHDKVERMEEQLDSVISQQKNLFLIVFQRFIIILTDHLVKCESEGRDYNTSWYKWMIERLQQVFLQHHEQVYRYTQTLENLIFTSDIDIHILEVFQQFCSLRS